MYGIRLVFLFAFLATVLAEAKPEAWRTLQGQGSPNVDSVEGAVRFFINKYAGPTGDISEEGTGGVDEMEATAIEAALSTLKHAQLTSGEDGTMRFKLSTPDDITSLEQAAEELLEKSEMYKDGVMIMHDEDHNVVVAPVKSTEKRARNETPAPLMSQKVENTPEHADTTDEEPTQATTARTTEMPPQEIDLVKLQVAITKLKAILSAYSNCDTLNKLEFLTSFLLLLLLFSGVAYIYHLKKYKDTVRQLVVDEVKSYNGKNIVLLVPAASKSPDEIVTMPGYVAVKTLDRY